MSWQWQSGMKPSSSSSFSWASVMMTSVELLVARPVRSVAKEWTGRPVTSPPSSRQTLSPVLARPLPDAPDVGQPARVGEAPDQHRAEGVDRVAPEILAPVRPLDVLAELEPSPRPCLRPVGQPHQHAGERQADEPGVLRLAEAPPLE